MRQISIRNVDSGIAAKLKRNAKRQGQSLNRHLQAVLRHGANLEEPGSNAPSHDLDALAGTWSPAQARAFERATAPFSKVDKALWR